MTELGDRIGVAPLRELGTLVQLVAHDGAQVRDTLSARAASLRAEELADAEGNAGKRDQSMLMAQILLGVGFAVFLGYPAVTNFLRILRRIKPTAPGQGVNDVTDTEAQLRMLMAWVHAHLQTRVQALRDEDPDRGDGILIWVIMVALLAAAAIAIVAIIVTKAKSTATDTKTQ